MRSFANILLGLFRPGRGIDGAEAGIKWLWVPLAAVLVASVILKTAIASPLQFKAEQAQVEAMASRQMESMPEADREQYEKAMAEAESSGDVVPAEAGNTGMAVMSAANMVFGVLGALLSVAYIATFFFVGAKTWANPVKYTTMLTIAGLSLVPLAIRNVVQALYMASRHVYLQYPGLGALVAAKDGMPGSGLAYALLSQIDIWVLWSLALLLGALLSKTMGIGKKRAYSSFAVFVLITCVLKAVPALVVGLFSGGGGLI